MKTKVVIFCLIIILCSIITPGASKGPTNSKILAFSSSLKFKPPVPEMIIQHQFTRSDGED